jgi:Fe-S cluster assembly protein SufD
MNAMIDHYRAEFQRQAEMPALLKAASRQAAWGAFEQQGFPGAKTEAWRYTRLGTLEKLALSCAVQAVPVISWEQLAPHCLLPQAPRLVLVDGLLSPTLSTVQNLPQGVSLQPTSQAGELPSSTDWQENPLSGFTAAFAAEGFTLSLDQNVHFAEPLLVLHVSVEPNRTAANLNRMSLQAGSEALVVEQWISLTPEATWNNQWLQVELAQNSKLTHVRWLEGGEQGWQWSRLKVSQQGGSEYHHHYFALSGRMGREEVEVDLQEPGANAHLEGAWWARGQEVQDVHTLVRHQAAHCESSQSFKGVLDERARAVFDGRVVVAPHAQKTVARQANHNLLLSRDAEVDTKPQLEILADDVKCSHGTTVGQINQDQLFYLLARGVGAADARAMLVEAFVQEIAQGVEHEPLRQILSERLHEVIHG